MILVFSRKPQCSDESYLQSDLPVLHIGTEIADRSRTHMRVGHSDPVGHALLSLLDNVRGDGTASVVSRHSPSEVHRLGSYVGYFKVRHWFGSICKQKNIPSIMATLGEKLDLK